jgi:hypothetical protein
MQNTDDKLTERYETVMKIHGYTEEHRLFYTLNDFVKIFETYPVINYQCDFMNGLCRIEALGRNLIIHVPQRATLALIEIMEESNNYYRQVWSGWNDDFKKFGINLNLEAEHKDV